ncbi:hypothetical protein CRM22_005032, partial [Opisthorchis felineus]
MLSFENRERIRTGTSHVALPSCISSPFTLVHPKFLTIYCRRFFIRVIRPLLSGPVPYILRMQPLEDDATYIDEMIRNAQAIPRTFLREAPTHISEGKVWASTFEDWKTATREKIDLEEEQVQTV